MKITSINLMSLLTVPLSIYLIVSGRVSWEIVCFVWLMEFELDVKLRR